GVAEQVFDPLFLQTTDHDFRAIEFHLKSFQDPGKPARRRHGARRRQGSEPEATTQTSNGACEIERMPVHASREGARGKRVLCKAWLVRRVRKDNAPCSMTAKATSGRGGGSG